MAKRAPRRVLISGLKGGVGKTTVTLNLAAHDTKRGKRVLLVELDPQTNATTTVTGRYSDEVTRSIADVLVEVSEGRDPVEAVRETLLSAQDPQLEALDDYARRAWGRLDILPATPEAAGLRLEPENYLDLAHILNSLDGAEGYDTVLMDSAPGISTLTTLGAYAADTTISVTEPAANSIAGVRQLIRQMLTPVQRYHDVALAGVLVNKVDVRQLEHRNRLTELTEELPDLVCRAWLPLRTVVQQAEGVGLPLHALSGPAAAGLTDLYAKAYRYLITNSARGRRGSSKET